MKKVADLLASQLPCKPSITFTPENEGKMAYSDRAIDVRVTPSFMSANVRALPEYNDDTASLFGPVESAFDVA